MNLKNLRESISTEDSMNETSNTNVAATEILKAFQIDVNEDNMTKLSDMLIQLKSDYKKELINKLDSSINSFKSSIM